MSVRRVRWWLWIVFMELPVDLIGYGLVGLVVTLIDRCRESRDRELRLARRVTELVEAAALGVEAP